MASFADRRALATAAWRTWGARGLARRGRYEVEKRSGSLRRSEDRWPVKAAKGARLQQVVLDPSVLSGPPVDTISLYGGLDLEVATPPDWHRHPITGHLFDPEVHWSELSDASPEAGDIKDLWELGRFGFLQPRLRHWATAGAEATAELIWSVIEDWYGANPRFRGPQWMCGQEASLRTIGVIFLAQALDESEATTDDRRTLVAQMVHDAVGRVRPTLGYALSQRNNHAISEAGFLWTASVLAPWLPDAEGLRKVAAQALSEAVDDQFSSDGSYAQHSPTYARVALHVLLWCLAVERSMGVEAPAGVRQAVARAAGHLQLLMVPDSEGKMPNLGGNDGALVFDLCASAIGDFRPLLRHATSAVGQSCGLPAGPWDQEAACFGVADGVGEPPAVPSTQSTHALTRGGTHLVMRAGPLSHRPAHADQLHVDLWFDGKPVAVDPGSFRYTAPAPWGNALAGEEVHNLVRQAGQAQAQRTGRFFWSRWSQARVCGRVNEGSVAALAALLVLPNGSALRRVVAVSDGLAVVLDDVEGTGNEVRWNFMDVEAVSTEPGATLVEGGYQARLIHGGLATVCRATNEDPQSGWHAPSYGQRQPLQAVTVASAEGGRVLSVFASSSQRDRLDGLIAALDAVPRVGGDGEVLTGVASALGEQ